MAAHQQAAAVAAAAAAAPSGVVAATCTAPVNIAVLKYWGKRDEELILPVNSSLSVTLHQQDLRTQTTVAASAAFGRDAIWLNGKEERIDARRLQNCLRAMRARAADRKDAQGRVVVSGAELARYPVHICSVNNFPTAAGLASSASGFACLVYTLAQLYGVTEEYPGELSTFARVGSGSASRSLAGGFVRWEKGVRADGTDSCAVQVVDETHWPDLQVLVLVVSDHKKETSSTAGMETSVQTSELLKFRAEHIVPARIAALEEAVRERDFEAFGKLTMQDSNQFHAVCLDTYPPIFYMNDISKRVISLLTKWNDVSGRIRAAYSFDAGPNAVLFVQKSDMRELLQILLHYFPPQRTPAASFFPKTELLRELGVAIGGGAGALDDGLRRVLGGEPWPDALKYILHTQPGPGPQVLPEAESLIDLSTGLPRTLAS